jgi:aryl-alcohol dehydrogenase-like predicted oxidoreductase
MTPSLAGAIVSESNELGGAGHGIKAVAERLETTPGAVAVAWTLRNSAVDGAIVGFRGPDQVDPILGATNLELGEDDVATIEGRV